MICLVQEFFLRELSKLFLPSSCHLLFISNINHFLTLPKRQILQDMRILQMFGQIHQAIIANIPKIVILDAPIRTNQLNDATTITYLIYFAPSLSSVMPFNTNLFTVPLFLKASPNATPPITVSLLLEKSKALNLHFELRNSSANLRMVSSVMF